MTSDDRFSFLLTALLASVVILGVSRSGRQPATGLPDPPAVGGAPHAAPIGPTPAPEGAADAAADATPVERDAASVLASTPWPAFASRLVLHPIVSQALPESDLEQGVPWHLAVDAAGRVSWTPRGRAGARAQPPGFDVATATASMHVAVLDASRAAADRDAAVRVIAREAAHRFPPPAVVLADEAGGPSGGLPEGFDRAAWIAPQESRPATSRAAGAATRAGRPSDRLAVRFGTATLDVSVASTFAARRDGLGGRTSLRRDEGLLFVYGVPEVHSFWMKNCVIALDILYLSDSGEVLALTTMQPPGPNVPDASLPRFVSPSPCRLVLEVAAGVAARSGIRRGSRLGLPPAVAGLVAKADP